MTEQHVPEPASPENPTSTHRGETRGQGRLITGFVVAAIIGGIVGGSIVAVFDRRSGGSVSSSAARVSNGTGNAADTAMCRATPVADEVLPSVVKVFANSGRAGGTGSGEIIRSGGYILTNNHVISVAANGGEVSVLYSDGKTSAATIVGRDPSTDLAVLKAADGAPGLPVIALGSSQGLQVGQPVVALGAPLGLASTVTSGIVSALDRYLPVPGDNGGTAHLVGAIQTDAAINPGNSGGALVDCAGRLVGINTAIATVPNAEGVSGGGSVGLGFAIPVDLAKPLSDEMIATGKVTHPTVGMQVQLIPPAMAQRAGTSAGLYVESVTLGGPAASAGLQPGDILTMIDGQPALSAEQLTVLTLTKNVGDGFAVTYERGGVSATATITLASGE